MGCGPLLRCRKCCTTIEASFDDAFLLSAPHPSGFARHLPHFVEKGARNRLIFERKQLPPALAKQMTSTPRLAKTVILSAS
jgi:hypothetical protein